MDIKNTFLKLFKNSQSLRSKRINKPFIGILSLLPCLMLALDVNASTAQQLIPSRDLNINGVRVSAYESQGTKGPGILLIHGNTSSANSFSKIMNSRFAKHHRVTAIDLPGFGKSDDATALYSIGFYADIIAKAAVELDVDNGVMVGWSLGGDLVLQASDQLPDVKGYFIFGTAPFGIAPELPPAFLSADESYAGAAVNYGFSADLSDNQIHDFVNAFFRPGYQDIPEYMYDDGRRTDPMTRATLLKAATGQDPSLQDEIAIVRSMTTPIAMLLGDQDALVRPEFMQALAPQMPTLYRSKTIIVKNSGHAIHWERPKAFIAHLRRFIRALH